MTASASVVEALAKYDADAALCPVRQNDIRSVEKCRKCGATQSDRCGQDHPYPVIEALRASIATPHPAEQDAREAVENPGGWLIKDHADGWFWTPIRMAAVAAMTEGHAVIDLLALTQAAPDGWRLVPVEPTETMLAAGESAAWDFWNSMPAIRAMPKAWTAMLSASPAPPAQGEGG